MKHHTLSRLVLLPGLLLAVQTVIFAAPPPERYEVELIVFRHLDQSRNTPEIPASSSIFSPSPLDLTLSEIPMPNRQLAVTPIKNPDHETNRQSGREPIRFYLLELHPDYPDFVPLSQAEHGLDQVYKRLEKIDAYEPILHVGWVQPVHDTDKASPYRFDPSKENGLSGTVTLYKERFLHLEIDLALEADPPPAEGLSFLGAGAKHFPEFYKLTASRRIRGSVAHYFDHPQFGVIARIRQVKSAANDPEANG